MVTSNDVVILKDLLVFCKQNGIGKISIPGVIEAIIPIVETKDIVARLPDQGVSDKPNPNFCPQTEEDLLFYSA